MRDGASTARGMPGEIDNGLFVSTVSSLASPPAVLLQDEP